MKDLLRNISITVHHKTYIKDPESSELGKKILESSIDLIHEIGFESFTFKKLGLQIGSNESSIYRYFENKHKLLLYLTSWYWGWIEYQLVFETNSIPDLSQRLSKAIRIVSRSIQADSSFGHIDETKLSDIVISEFSKSYLTKEVDSENKDGYFSVYKRLIHRLRDMITQLKPDYPYPASLASTVIEGALHQHFLKAHFPSITDCNQQEPPPEFLIHLVFSTLNLK